MGLIVLIISLFCLWGPSLAGLIAKVGAIPRVPDDSDNGSHSVPPWASLRGVRESQKEVHRPGMKVTGEDKLDGAFLRKQAGVFRDQVTLDKARRDHNKKLRRKMQ